MSRGVGGGGGGTGKGKGRRLPARVQRMCSGPCVLLDKLNTFTGFSPAEVAADAYGLEVKNKEICIHYHT